MTGQIPDTVVWKQKKYDLIGYDGGALFDPLLYEMQPSPLHTACWRGFFCKYKIIRNRLYLENLNISTEDNNYSPVNSAMPKKSRDAGVVYSKIRLFIPFTGNIRIGTEFQLKFYVHMGFQKPSAYGTVWDLAFFEGKMTGNSDISEQAREIEGEYKDQYSRKEITDRIDDAYDRNMKLR